MAQKNWKLQKDSNESEWWLDSQHKNGVMVWKTPSFFIGKKMWGVRTFPYGSAIGSKEKYFHAKAPALKFAKTYMRRH